LLILYNIYIISQQFKGVFMTPHVSGSHPQICNPIQTYLHAKATENPNTSVTSKISQYFKLIIQSRTPISKEAVFGGICAGIFGALLPLCLTGIIAVTAKGNSSLGPKGGLLAFLVSSAAVGVGIIPAARIIVAATGLKNLGRERAIVSGIRAIAAVIGTAIVTASAVGAIGVAAGAEASTAQQMAKLGGIASLVFGGGWGILGVFCGGAAKISNIVSNENDTRIRRSHFPVFGAFLRTHLRSMNEKNAFLEKYKHCKGGATEMFARSYVAQLLSIPERLTTRNTPDFFRKTITVGAKKGTTLMAAINDLKREIEENFSPEEAAQLDFFSKGVPENEKVRAIKGKANLIALAIDNTWNYTDPTYDITYSTSDENFFASDDWNDHMLEMQESGQIRKTNPFMPNGAEADEILHLSEGTEPVASAQSSASSVGCESNGSLRSRSSTDNIN
jgi:hypothetical protein